MTYPNARRLAEVVRALGLAPPRGRDRLPVPASAALAGPAERAGLPRDHRRPGRRAVRRRAGGGRREHDADGLRTARRPRAGRSLMAPPGPGWRRKARRVVGGAINVLGGPRDERPPPRSGRDAARARGLSGPGRAHRARHRPPAGGPVEPGARAAAGDGARRERSPGDPPSLPDRGGRRRQPRRRHRSRRSRPAPRRPSRRGPGKPRGQRQCRSGRHPARPRGAAARAPAPAAHGAAGVLRRRGARHAGLARATSAARRSRPCSGW